MLAAVEKAPFVTQIPSSVIGEQNRGEKKEKTGGRKKRDGLIQDNVCGAKCSLISLQWIIIQHPVIMHPICMLEEEEVNKSRN